MFFLKNRLWFFFFGWQRLIVHPFFLFGFFRTARQSRRPMPKMLWRWSLTIWVLQSPWLCPLKVSRRINLVQLVLVVTFVGEMVMNNVIINCCILLKNKPIFFRARRSDMRRDRWVHWPFPQPELSPGHNWDSPWVRVSPGTEVQPGRWGSKHDPGLGWDLDPHRGLGAMHT